MEHTTGYDQFNGTRKEVLEELTERLNYWHRMSTSDRKAERYADAIAGIEAGSFSVKVGHTIYSVSPDDTSAEVPVQRDEKADNSIS